jgi:alpha-tubulin suppressor-like RCC1 family protein
VLGKATSEPATLTVQKIPSVTKQPASLTVNEGHSATFEATSSGFPAPTVQWEISTDGRSSWSAVAGATADQLTIAGTLTSEDGNEYRAVFTNAAGTVTSNAATLTVQAPPLVTEQPQGTTVEVGETAVFEAAASGFPTPTVQWELSTNNGSTWSAIAGATSNRLTIENAQASQSWYQYRATFTNAAASVPSNAAMLTVATTHFSAVAWGSNLFRQLGDGFKEQSSNVPVAVSGLKFVTAVAAGMHHSLALLANGTVEAWGANGNGQLGDGSTAESSVPVAVHGLSSVKAIAAGSSHSLALLANGTVMAWGDNEQGQLGIGTGAEDSEVPVAVSGLTGVKAISAGANFSLALLTNGTVMAWGENETGELGTGNTKSSNVPVAVKSLSGVSAISAGREFSLALLNNKTVKAWGNDEKGQLGDVALEEEEATSSDLPVEVETLANVTAIAAGSDHGLALLSAGTAMAWGDDSFGELGNGTTVPTHDTTPVAVSGLSGVTAISAGGQNSAAVLTSGSVMTWGSDSSGVLGDGITGGISDIPVAVVGLAKAASISAGRFAMLAFGEPIPVVTGVSPQIGPAGGGETVTISGDTFTGATAVKFGTTAATHFTVESDTSITASAPPGTGTVNVTVTTPAGTSPPVAADRYTYQAIPTVSKLSVKSGPPTGETSVTITGTEFTGATKVTFGATNALKFTVNSATSITAVSPPAVGGTVDVNVTNAGGTSASSTRDHFKYVPAVESVTPNSGSTKGGESVTVTGNGFALGSATSFMFGKVKSKSVNCTSSTSCTVSTPAEAAATVDVKATVNKAISTVNPGDHFTYS